MQIKRITVLPDTPEQLNPLKELAYDLYFAWHPDVIELFKKLDPKIWMGIKHNPVKMLNETPQSVLETMANDHNYIAELQTVYDRYRTYLEKKTWYEARFSKTETPTIAYFSCEFGIHECLPIYSGGLGVLAGDHIKSASDLGIPLIGIGLLYRHGYFNQEINADGRQQEVYPENDTFTMPITLLKNPDQSPITESLELAGETVHFQVWETKVGRCRLLLLDTNLQENAPHHRTITNALYDANRDTRIRQEMLLGVGGCRIIKKLGLNPHVYHINEGHSAFLLLERIRDLMSGQGLRFQEASEVVRASSVFTTHTPVPAGNERFSIDLIEKYFSNLLEPLQLDWHTFLSFGRERPEDQTEEFCLTVLALKFAGFANGVSKLHGVVSRQMWSLLYSQIPCDELPIGHVTNGVHAGTWISPPLKNLISRYMSQSNGDEVADFDLWKRIESVPDDELWELQDFKRRRLVNYVRKQTKAQLTRRNAGPIELMKINDLLSPKALTIGFARRFAAYKRGNLIFSNPERLAKLLNNTSRPVQIVIAGKAHPADEYGKEIIHSIIEMSKRPEFCQRIVFIENYDISVARKIIQGVDVWLNNPIRPKEASGTSGMKAAMNGAINLSILDGWWDEAYTPEVGWSIGHGEALDDQNLQNQIESDLLYAVLEQEVIPLFFDRDEESELPNGWIQMMKNSIRELGIKFNSHRMLKDYLENYYDKADRLQSLLREDRFHHAKALSAWRQHIAEQWSQIEIVAIDTDKNEHVLKGETIEITATIKTQNIKTEELIVECYHGPLDNDFQITKAGRLQLQFETMEGELARYRGQLNCSQGGHYGYAIRLLPGHPHLTHEFMPNLLKWF